MHISHLTAKNPFQFKRNRKLRGYRDSVLIESVQTDINPDIDNGKLQNPKSQTFETNFENVERTIFLLLRKG